MASARDSAPGMSPPSGLPPGSGAGETTRRRPRGATTRPRTAPPGRFAWFLLLAFGVSWSLWAGAVLATDTAWATVLRGAGTFGPALGALLLAGGPGERRLLLRAHVRFRGAWRTTLAALLAPPVLVGVALWVDVAGGAEPGIAWPEPFQWPLIVGYVLVLGGPLGEELGWRGHALPKLERRFGPVWATVLVGAIWTAWHLPLFLMPGTVQQDIPLWLFSWQILATSFLYTWVRHRAPASLVPALALHTSFNVTVGVVLTGSTSTPQLRPLVIALVLATAVAAVLVRRPEFRQGSSVVVG